MIDRRDNTSEGADHSGGSSADGIDSRARDLAWLLSPSAARSAARARELDEGLLVCDHCHSRLMYPAHCEEQGRERWYIELRCPDCGDIRSGLFAIEMLDALDRELAQAEAEIEADLARMTHGNMVDYVTRFVAALNAGAIEPGDFNA